MEILMVKSSSMRKIRDFLGDATGFSVEIEWLASSSDTPKNCVCINFAKMSPHPHGKNVAFWGVKNGQKWSILGGVENGQKWGFSRKLRIFTSRKCQKSHFSRLKLPKSPPERDFPNLGPKIWQKNVIFGHFLKNLLGFSYEKRGQKNTLFFM